MWNEENQWEPLWNDVVHVADNAHSNPLRSTILTFSADMIVKALLVTMICLWSGVAEAQQDFGSGKYYLAACKGFLASTSVESAREALDEGACFGAVQTVTILREFLREFLPVKYRFCMPEGATTGDAIRLIVSYMESRPERLHEQFVLLAIEALAETWPCPTPGRL